MFDMLMAAWRCSSPGSADHLELHVPGFISKPGGGGSGEQGGLLHFASFRPTLHLAGKCVKRWSWNIKFSGGMSFPFPVCH